MFGAKLQAQSLFRYHRSLQINQTATSATKYLAHRAWLVHLIALSQKVANATDKQTTSEIWWSFSQTEKCQNSAPQLLMWHFPELTILVNTISLHVCAFCLAPFFPLPIEHRLGGLGYRSYLMEWKTDFFSSLLLAGRPTLGARDLATYRFLRHTTRTWGSPSLFYGPTSGFISSFSPRGVILCLHWQKGYSRASRRCWWRALFWRL